MKVENENRKFISKNNVQLVGTVVRKFCPKSDVLILTVAVNGRGDRAHYPAVTFYGNAAKEINEHLGDLSSSNRPRVRIEATIQTRKREIDGETRYYQDIIGTSFEDAPTKLESVSGMRDLGTRKADSVNEVCIAGQVVNNYEIVKAGAPRPFGVILTIKTQDKRANFPHVVFFGAQARKAIACEIGDNVCTVGRIETRVVEKDGKKITQESVSGEDIAIL